MVLLKSLDHRSTRLIMVGGRGFSITIHIMLLMLRPQNIKYSCFAILIFLSGSLHAESALYKYAINLESSKKQTPISLNLNSYNLDKKYKVYQTQVSLGQNKSFYRLRLGFFKSKKEANSVARKLKSKYSKLWIDRLHKQDRAVLVEWIKLNNITRNNEQAIKTETAVTTSPKNNLNKRLNAETLMARAKKAMTEKKYRLAAGIYTRVIQLKESEYHKEALEFLGLARERNGQLIHARAEYRLYLKKYPKGEDTSRVRQRLLSLQTILLKPKKRLKKQKTKRSDWQFFGSLLQFYRKDVFSSNQTETSNETLSTNANILLRKRTESLNIKSQFNVSHLKYIDNSLRDDKERVNILFIDIADINNNNSIRLGRQSQNKGGVLGKMDGAWVGYRLNPQWKLNFVAGYPVQTSTSNAAQKNRPFWGVSADIETQEKNWNFNIYTISQEVDSITDRNAIGGEVRYRKGKQNHFALIDYDTYFSELNTFFYVGNWRFDNNAAVILTVNHRNSPILTTTNAIQGQLTPTIEALLLTYTEDELKQIAKDRTSKYNSAAISTTIPLSDKWTFSADATVSNLSSTPASANIVAIEGTGNEVFYGAQFIGYNVFNADETTRYQIRLDDTKTFKRTRYTVSSRFKLKNNKWRLRPQITFESKNQTNGGKTTKVTPAFKLDYKVKRSFKLEFDVSYESAKTTTPVAITENNYYLSAGFIWDF